MFDELSRNDTTVNVVKESDKVGWHVVESALSAQENVMNFVFENQGEVLVTAFRKGVEMTTLFEAVEGADEDDERFVESMSSKAW